MSASHKDGTQASDVRDTIGTSASITWRLRARAGGSASAISRAGLWPSVSQARGSGGVGGAQPAAEPSAAALSLRNSRQSYHARRAPQAVQKAAMAVHEAAAVSRCGMPGCHHSASAIPTADTAAPAARTANHARERLARAAPYLQEPTAIGSADQAPVLSHTLIGFVTSGGRRGDHSVPFQYRSAG